MTTSSTSPSSCAEHVSKSAELICAKHRGGLAVAARRLGPARVWCTDRRGGVSSGVYASLNLGDHVGDDAAAVSENRQRLAATLGLGGPDRFVWLHQVHGPDIAVVDGPPDEPPSADGAVTTRPGVPLVVLTADCAPVALASDDAVAVVHAGWVGLLAGVVAAAVRALRAAGHGPVRAFVGPCISPDRYEFGAADLARLVARFGPSVAASTSEGRSALDLAEGVRVALAEEGIDDIETAGRCTASSPGLFSHRRDRVTGRQALVAVLGP